MFYFTDNALRLAIVGKVTLMSLALTYKNRIIREENQKIKLKIGSHYIAHGHDSRSFEIIPRTSKAGLAATIREFLLYRLLKSRYLAEDVIEPKKEQARFLVEQ